MKKFYFLLILSFSLFSSCKKEVTETHYYRTYIDYHIEDETNREAMKTFIADMGSAVWESEIEITASSIEQTDAEATDKFRKSVNAISAEYANWSSFLDSNDNVSYRLDRTTIGNVKTLYKVEFNNTGHIVQ